MNAPLRRASLDRVLLDMNTQCDFLLPRGALPVANRSEILPNIRKIMNWGRIHKTPVISSLESHRVGEHGNGIPPHCVDRTAGQKKLPFTLMPRRIILPGDNTLDLPLDPFRRYQQVIFTKRDRDFLSNPKADRLVNTLLTKCYVVFGVLAERCIKTSVLGLLGRQRQIIVIRDACGCWYASEAELAFRQMDAKGAIVATTEELLSGAAEARLDERFIPKIVDDKAASASLGEVIGRVNGRAVTWANDLGKAGGNGRAVSPRPRTLPYGFSQPVNHARRNPKTPAKRRGKSSSERD